MIAVVSILSSVEGVLRTPSSVAQKHGNEKTRRLGRQERRPPHAQQDNCVKEQQRPKQLRTASDKSKTKGSQDVCWTKEFGRGWIFAEGGEVERSAPGVVFLHLASSNLNFTRMKISLTRTRTLSSQLHAKLLRGGYKGEQDVHI